MSKIAIVYHSGYGHTAVVAEALATGARSVPGATVTLYKADDLTSAETGAWADLAAADAIVFGAPTYMGSASAVFKQFMDASSKAWYGDVWKNKLAAGFTNSASWSGDKLNTLQQLAVFAAQHGMIWISTGMKGGYNHSGGTPEDLNRVGSFLGLATQANADQGPDVAPPSADRKTAEAFGKRIAEVTDRWVAAQV